MTGKITGFGELLLRLSPMSHGELIAQSDGLAINFAGAEANIIADLSLLGHKTQFITAIPDNPIGKKAFKFLNQLGTATDNILFDQGRMGAYYIEHGTSIRGTQVTYDRKESSFTQLSLNTNNWEKILENSSHLVVTGITPALSKKAEDSMLNALSVAKSNGCKIVFDLNFRRTLWTIEAAKKSFNQILPYVNILFGNIGSVNDVFGADIATENNFESLQKGTEKAIKFVSQLGDFDTVGMTIRQQKTASDNVLSSMIKQEGRLTSGLLIPTIIKDRLGGGDAFVAGVLHGMLSNWDIKKTIDFGTAAFALTQTLSGDINYMDEKQILAVSQGDLKGYVKR